MQVTTPVRGGIMRSAISANKHAVIGETVPMGRVLFILGTFHNGRMESYP